jgi:hypothetical protein
MTVTKEPFKMFNLVKAVEVVFRLSLAVVVVAEAIAASDPLAFLVGKSLCVVPLAWVIARRLSPEW